jgi:formate/nitrite transporter FocA (FNT family)
MNAWSTVDSFGALKHTGTLQSLASAILCNWLLSSVLVMLTCHVTSKISTGITEKVFV